jgi:PAS domain S-box-containing protein
MKRTVEGLTILVFVTGWAILAVVGIVSYSTNSALIHDSSSLARTHEALQCTEKVRSRLDAAESAVRGYAITNDSRYLREYANSELSLNQVTAELRQLISGTPAEKNIMAEFDPDFESRVTLFRQTIRVSQLEGTDVGKRLIATNRGLELTNKIHGQLNQIAAEETRLLQARQERTQSLGLYTRLVIWIGTTFGLVIVAIATIVIRRENQSRKRARQRVAVQYATTRLLSESSTLSQAAKRLLPELALTLEFEIAELWMMDSDTERLRCQDFWLAAHIPSQYADEIRHSSLGIGEGIPGRVYADQEPLWIEELRKDDVCAGENTFYITPLRAAVAVPVLIWPDVAGVLLMMTRREAPLDRDMFQMLATIGAQLGQFLTRRKAVESLHETTELQRAILQSANFSIIATDANGIIKVMNATAEQWLQYDARELIGRSTPVIFHRSEEISVRAAQLSGQSGSKVDPGIEALIAKARRGAIDENDWTYIRRDGSSFAVQLSVTALRNASGTVTGFLLIGKDITERREVDRMKNEFISVVSHELRTPLTSVRGSLGLLAAGMLGNLSDKAKRMLQIGINNTDRLVRLINDILDIERLESGKVALERQQVSAEHLLMQSVDSMRGIAEKANIHLRRQPFDALLHADPDRVVQTLMNLVSNAIKFSEPEQSIEIGGFSNGKMATLYVRDYGRGIPAEKQSLIFERFQQVDASDSREKGGTGLGLAICRTIVQQHGGRIWVESTPGEGSAFYFTLPLYEEVPTVVAPVELSGAQKVMICDDDAWLRGIVSNLLRQAGFVPVAASSGIEMLERIKVERPDVLLLDLVMPGMSGWESLARLRKEPEFASLPVIVLSGLDEDTERAKASSDIACWVQKPFDARRLYQAISMVLPRHRQIVLLAEDDSDLARVITSTLENSGIEPMVAHSALQAISLADQRHPDALILDITLAEGDGYEVVNRLRQHNTLRNTPVVVYSAAELSPADKERLRLGETLFLTKAQSTPGEMVTTVLEMMQKPGIEEQEASVVDKARAAHR